jgi:hypothetical protein
MLDCGSRVPLSIRGIGILIALLVVCGVGLGYSAARARADETVYACGSTEPNNLFYESDAVGMEEQQDCQAPGGSLDIYATSSAADGARSYWATVAPAGLQINEALASSMSIIDLNYSGDSYGGGFFWGPSGSNGVEAASPQSSAEFGVAQATAGFPSSEFGFQMVCGASSCPNDGQSFYIGSIQLGVGETQGPSITAGGLWNQSGWVSGAWPITVGGDSPSGVCSLSATINGIPAAGISAAYPPNQTVWHQCAGGLAGTLNTALVPNGADTLSVADGDAAGLSNAATETIDVDNQTPTVSLSGPATALSTAGTQEVDVSVGAGPSGAYGADCSVDGGASVFYAGASSQVPVAGVGEHSVTCTGMSNAVSAAGVRSISATETFSVDVQQPTVEAITFSKIADSVHCREVVRRVKVLGKAHIVRLHGHRVSVRRVHFVKRRVRKCFAATARRRVLVALRRHGRLVRRHGRVVRVHRVEKVVLLPHEVHQSVRMIRHGRGSTVSGVLLLSDGTPVVGQTISILAAPNTGASPQFAAVSSAVSDANGFWVAKIPAGPSRLLEADYAGTSTTAPASSTTVKLRVPARLAILSHTVRVAWGQTVRFTGELYGGFIPPGGVNLRLRYGYGRSWTTYGVKTHVGGDGRFATSFTFGPGDPRDHLRFRFEFATLPGGAYPWAPARSNIAEVVVGGRPHAHRDRRRR